MGEGALDLDLSDLWTLATRGFALGPHSLHGPDHWQRVERNAIAIGRDCGADLLIVRLFAVLHDSKRLNEMHDPEHGARAAAWARFLRKDHFVISDAQLLVLEEACVFHDKGRVSDDATIGSCWDADRLDLPRVGITPTAKFMSTAAGRRLADGRSSRPWLT